MRLAVICAKLSATERSTLVATEPEDSSKRSNATRSKSFIIGPVSQPVLRRSMAFLKGIGGANEWFLMGWGPTEAAITFSLVRGVLEHG